jgi:hypothetical protein
VAVSNDQTRAITGGDDALVHVWDLKKKKQLSSMPGHHAAVICTAISAKGDYGASGSIDGTVRVWDLAGLTQRRVLIGHLAPVTGVALLPDGKRLLSASEDGTLRLWNLANAREIARFTTHTGPVRALAVIRSGGFALSGGDDRTIRLLPLPPTGAKLPPPGEFQWHDGPREPIPSAEAQAPIEAKLKQEQFRAEFADAVVGPKRAALARKLLLEAEKPGTDPTTVFVLLRMARELGLSGGDVETVLAVVDEVAERFQVDRLAAQAAAVEALAPSFMPATARRNLVVKATALAEQCIDREQLDRAGKVLAAIHGSLPQVRDPHLTKQVTALAAEVQRLTPKWEAVRPAWEKLREHPDDPEANQAVGEYLCFQKHAWNEGLPKLARGSDPQWKRLAQADLDASETVQSQVAVADGWWGRAEKESGTLQVALRRRACWWYAMVESDASGATLDRVKELLAQVRAQSNDNRQ